jgi:hypothetical protein
MNNKKTGKNPKNIIKTSKARPSRLCNFNVASKKQKLNWKNKEIKNNRKGKRGEI